MKVGKETVLCVQVYEWVKNNTDLASSYYHIPLEGKRGFQFANLLQAMGFKAGMSDILITRPCNGKSGLWIEVKIPGKKPTKTQLEFLQQRIDEGYHAFWADNFDAIVQGIKKFYNL